jgi:hypothetical protein
VAVRLHQRGHLVDATACAAAAAARDAAAQCQPPAHYLNSARCHAMLPHVCINNSGPGSSGAAAAG